MHLHAKLLEGRLDGAAAAQARLAHGYSGVVKSKKSANAASAAEQWALMLASVRGVSAARARAIAAAYAGPAALTDAVRAHGSPKAAVKALADLKLGGDGGRRLGPAIASKLVDVFGSAAAGGGAA